MATALQQQQQQRLHRTANNVIAVARVTKSSYCDHAGWASKQGSIIKTWKRRYFVLKGRELIYFAERSPSGKGIDEKGRLRVVGVEFTPEFSNGLLIKGELKNQSMKIQLESNAESLEWYARVKEALQDGGNGPATGSGAGGAGGGKSGTNAGSQVTMQGWLFKEGQNFKTWKKRYMTLAGRVIKYHAKANEAPLGEARVNDYNINAGRPFALDVFSDNNRIFRIAAESFADIEAWDQAIAKAIGKAPCFGDPYADQTAPFLGDTFAEPCACEGWLYKRGQRSTAWQKRYFTLSGCQLAYHESPGDAHPRGEGAVVDLTLGADGSNSMEIQLDSGRTLSVSADSRDQVALWVDAICAVLGKDPAALEVRAANPRASLAAAGSSSRLLRRGLSGAGNGRASLGAGLAYLTGGDGDNDAGGGSDASEGEGDSERRKTGWLKKQGRNFKSWKRRFFVIEDCAVSYFEQLDEPPKGSGVIQHAAVNPGFPNCLDITLTTGRVLRVSAESPDEIRAWLLHVADVIENAGAAALDAQAAAASPPRGSSVGAGLGLMRRQSSSLDAATATEPGRGWLMKKGKNFKTWKRRYFVLEGKKLSYAGGVGDSPLGCGLVSYVTLGNERPFCIDVRFQNGRILNVAAGSEPEMLAWCKALQASVRVQSKPGDVAEFDFDDNDDDAGDGAGRHSVGLRRPSLGPQLPPRASLGGGRPSAARSAGQLGRGSSLSSDESFDDGVPYADLGRVSLDAGLPGCSGWLRKEGSTIKSWKLRYFTLSSTTLSYFKSDNGPLLKTLKVCHVLIMRTKKFCIEVTTESGRKLLVAADSSAEFERWLEALRQAVAAEKGRKDGSANKILSRLVRDDLEHKCEATLDRPPAKLTNDATSLLPISSSSREHALVVEEDRSEKPWTPEEKRGLVGAEAAATLSLVDIAREELARLAAPTAAPGLVGLIIGTIQAVKTLFLHSLLEGLWASIDALCHQAYEHGCPGLIAFALCMPLSVVALVNGDSVLEWLGPRTRRSPAGFAVMNDTPPYLLAYHTSLGLGAASTLTVASQLIGFSFTSLLAGLLPNPGVAITASSIIASILTLATILLVGANTGGAIWISLALADGSARRAEPAQARRLRGVRHRHLRKSAGAEPPSPPGSR
ncbi:hypothetical protein PybrP1_006215 [[Pythium] brassicae (nom. inval.)]|nr:hypothetical protein PybrP1_006215 [[Pythium] brassicae (nom. inval.)]